MARPLAKGGGLVQFPAMPRPALDPDNDDDGQGSGFGRRLMPAISAELFVATGQALFGTAWQSELARQLSIRDPRRVREYATGERRSGLALTQALARLVVERRAGLDEIEAKLLAEIDRLKQEERP